VAFGGEVLAHLPQRAVICKGVDLSTCGMCIRPSSSVTGGAFLRVSFSLPDREGRLHGIEAGTLVVREGGAWALKFVQLSSDAVDRIARFVDMRLASRRARRTPSVEHHRTTL
jgi:hypothetical protein